MKSKKIPTKFILAKIKNEKFISFCCQTKKITLKMKFRPANIRNILAKEDLKRFFINDN